MDYGLPTNIELTNNKLAKQTTIEVTIKVAMDVCKELDVDHRDELAGKFKTHKKNCTKTWEKNCVSQMQN